MEKTFYSFSYNFETYSVKDIARFILNLGHHIVFSPLGGGSISYGFHVEDTAIVINLPLVKDILKKDFHPAYNATGNVVWECYDLMYFENGYNSARNLSLLKRDRQLFLKLKKNFAMNKNEYPKAIKDLKWLQGVEKIKRSVKIETFEDLENIGVSKRFDIF